MLNRKFSRILYAKILKSVSSPPKGFKSNVAKAAFLFASTYAGAALRAEIRSLMIENLPCEAGCCVNWALGRSIITRFPESERIDDAQLLAALDFLVPLPSEGYDLEKSEEPLAVLRNLRKEEIEDSLIRLKKLTKDPNQQVARKAQFILEQRRVRIVEACIDSLTGKRPHVPRKRLERQLMTNMTNQDIPALRRRIADQPLWRRLLLWRMQKMIELACTARESDPLKKIREAVDLYRQP